MNTRSIRAAFALVLALAPAALVAQEPAPAAAAPSAASVSGLRGDVLWQLSDVEKKLVSLAEATPQEKFSWRPAPGVRSISEVYMHITGGNYFLPTFVGQKPPEGLSRDMEKTVTEKAKVVDAMKKSFDHARKAVQATPDADLDKKIKLFGQDSTQRMVLLLLMNHSHEHLGQAIAYARTNGIRPPWSEETPSAPAPEKKPATK